MDQSDDRPSSGVRWVAVGLIAALALTALAYFTVPEFHRQSLVWLTHGQSERKTVAVVIEDRHMDPHFESDLRGFVPSATRISVTAVPGDREAMAFAQEIAAWLRANGWQNVQGATEHKPRPQEHLLGTNLQVNPKGGMELIVGPRPDSAP